jgi:hypothetical protein|tara:strand:+ start:396 stop:635 length:240 start_codon:yes stop_codon:yes gene_type:complete
MRRRESELLVLVRDARGVREETPLRVHAKFDDEEKITVRYLRRRKTAAAVSSSELGGSVREAVVRAFPVDRNESSAFVK